MTLNKLLSQFYKDNDLPDNGGDDQKTFKMKLIGLTFTFPNPKFRRDVIHVHDLQHILNNCDVSWKGEGYIAGWEIATGMWKHFPVGFFSIWAMGYSLFLYPKAVFKGFIKGINNVGIIDLNKSKDEFLKMEFDELLLLTSKENPKKIGFFQYLQFAFWGLICQLFVIFPLIILVCLFILL
ncbi:MAG: hypothetical protein P8I93_02445 [Crocinitomicaceae bacterium]|nr:hypothetical protein [Crocinitomicaceae bacterium]